MKKRVCDLPEMENVRTCYYIRDDGSLLSYSGHNGKDIDRYRVLKPNAKSSGYLEYALVCNDYETVKWVRAHKLVALAFCDGFKKRLLIHHRNGNKQDNRASNLEWITAKSHSRLTNSKKMYQYTLEGELVREYKYAVEAKQYGFSNHAFRCAAGLEKTHKGFVFSYVPLSKEGVFQRLSKAYPR